MKSNIISIDQLTMEDCVFFAAHNRQYRARNATVDELVEMQEVAGAELLLLPGRKLIAVVKRVAVAKCTVLRFYLETDVDAPVEDFEEDGCRALFEAAAPPEALAYEAEWVRARA